MVGSITICIPLTLLLTLSLAHPQYQEQIPNGNNVPHPCKANYRWPGVGHENPGGGGVRNDFGLAFAAEGHMWTLALCKADTDGDGMTNGQELGDAGCTWKPNTVPSRVDNITHPGICDPYNSDRCKNKTTFVTCDLDAFQACEALNNTNVKTINLTFPETRVPSTETNYMCFSFDLPNDQDYHIVANQPIISNQNVLHHMLLYGCKTADEPKEPAAVACGMSTTGNCGSIIGMWTVGATGSCFTNHAGFRIGKTGYSRVRLQIHYNNPQLIQNYTDSSGMRLYYQPVQPGDQDLAVLMVGQLLLQLPPGQSRVQVEASFPPNCTRLLVTKPAQVVSAANHMHYLGKSMNVSVYRNGTKLTDLTYDPAYSYDSPVAHIHDPPFALLPGDEIKTICVYNTLSSKRYVYYGESTSDEMCFGFITFYPNDSLASDAAASFGNYSMCDIYLGTPMAGCNWTEFTNFGSPVGAKIANDLMKNCNLDGFCRPECRDVLNGVKDNPCLKGVANQWITYSLSSSQEGVNFLGRLRSCPMADNCTNHCQSCDADGGDDAADKLMINSVLLFLISALVMFV